MVDMPFSESGIQPDIIINPHAFPSRMTIGMLVESMAGKAAAMHGLAQDATPFTFVGFMVSPVLRPDRCGRFSESDTAIDYFGKQLRAAGYNYYGNEPMYSGITGQEFTADIYFGVVYYQRLRHMVLDKFQVRTTGPVDPLTRQPVKVRGTRMIFISIALTAHIGQGRKRAGGIRFGEMERDALIAHGTSFLLQDRLMNCSDYSTTWVCRTCGSLISLGYDDGTLNAEASKLTGSGGEYCRLCRDNDDTQVLNTLDRNINPSGNGDIRMAAPSDHVLQRQAKGSNLDIVAVPFVFRYLCAELASMGIAVSLEVR